MTIQPIGKVGEGKKTAVIAICTLTEIQNKAYATHLQFAYKLAKDNPDYQFLLFTPHRMTIANFRNMAAQAALDCKAEFVMFIDDDAILINQASIFKTLKEKDKHIIMPVVYIRGYPFKPMFFKFVTDKELIKEGKGLDFYDDFKTCGKIQKDGLLEVAAIGCHACLIKTEVFQAMEKPFFMTGMYNTEDVYFCLKCRDYIENIEIFVDTTISVGHLLDSLWVDDTNVDTLREFYKKLKITDSIEIKDLFHQPSKIKESLKELGEDFEA